MENTQANEKYYRQNGDVVQGADITSIRRQQLKDSIRNNRLGSYNAHGRYTLSPRITKEILGITKYIYKQHFDDVMKESKDVLEFKSTASIPVFGQMEFRIVFKEKFAKLYLIENVYREFNGYQEIYGEQITEINCEDDRDDVVDYVLSLLNVKILDETDEGKIPEEDPEKVKAIIFNKLYLSIVAKNYLKESADEERETFEDLINKLKEEGGEYGKRVLKHFIDRIEKRPDIMQLKDEDGYNEALNDALIGALEVATTEEDMKDPHNKKIYDDIYNRRYKKTEEDLTKAQEDVSEKDFKRVADGVLGRAISDKLFGDPAEIASLIGEKREETRQEPQDNSFLEDLLTNPIIKREIDKIAGRTVGQTRQDPTATDEAAQAAADQEAARREEAAGGQTVDGEEQSATGGVGNPTADKGPQVETNDFFREAMSRQQTGFTWGAAPRTASGQSSTAGRGASRQTGSGYRATGGVRVEQDRENPNEEPSYREQNGAPRERGQGAFGSFTSFREGQGSEFRSQGEPSKAPYVRVDENDRQFTAQGEGLGGASPAEDKEDIFAKQEQKIFGEDYAPWGSSFEDEDDLDEVLVDDEDETLTQDGDKKATGEKGPSEEPDLDPYSESAWKEANKDNPEEEFTLG